MDSRNLLTEQELKDLLGQGSGQEEEWKTDLKLKMVLEFPLEVSVCLGSSQLTIRELLDLTVGAVIELDTMIEEPVELVVNGKVFAGGEVVSIGETFGVRLKYISGRQERVETLR